MLVKGIEPPTYALRVRCSTPELHQHKKKETTEFISNDIIYTTKRGMFQACFYAYHYFQDAIRCRQMLSFRPGMSSLDHRIAGLF